MASEGHFQISDIEMKGNQMKTFLFSAGLAVCLAILGNPSRLEGTCWFCSGQCVPVQAPKPSDCEAGLYDNCDCYPICDCNGADPCAECPGEEENPNMDHLVLSDGWTLQGTWIRPDAFGVRSACGSQLLVHYTDEGMRSRHEKAETLTFRLAS